MNTLFGILAGVTGAYSLAIIIRILMSWFQGPSPGRPAEILGAVTDPYLDWFRRFPLRLANFDLSPIAALGVLTIAQNIFSILARGGRITAGFLLSMLLGIVWSAVSFVLGFCLILLILRAFAYFTNRNIYSSFWRIIDNLAKPVQYRIARILFGRRIVHFSTEILVSTAALLAVRIGLGFVAGAAQGLLLTLPF